MSFHLNSIERLSEETRSRLRSTQILTSLPQIVSELLQNSLDANASHIDVGVNYKEWMCWVQDNGIGISKDGLEKLGAENEAGRYSVLSCFYRIMEVLSLFSQIHPKCMRLNLRIRSLPLDFVAKVGKYSRSICF